MTSKAAKQPNIWWQKYAMEHLVIDMTDNNELYCDVISESNVDKTYRVSVNENLVAPTACHCICEAFQYNAHCKHCDLVSSFYAKLYKNNTASNTTQYQAKQAAKATPSIASSSTASYVMPSALLAKLASISEEETARAAKINAEVDAVAAETAKNDTAEHLEEVYAELRETKTLKVGIKGSAALAMNREPVLNNAPQSDVTPSWLKVLPSWQQKQQEALAS